MRELVGAEPVLVDCPRGAREVRIRAAFAVEPGLYAPIESVEWELAGEIVTAFTKRDGQVRKIWKAVTTGGTWVKSDTRAGVIAALLDARGEFEVTIDQTIPPLFDLEGHA